uniref:Uncharacterized protein n=1 Tax=Sus scrofa TaxID=9823 RepID=A0A8D0VKF7_PIG
MALALRDLQRAVPLRRARLRRALEALRAALGVQRFAVGVVCVDNERIRQINRIYRRKNAPTDVLAFPFHENLKAGEIPQPAFADDYNLGDIFLGVEYILQQRQENEDYYDLLTVTATHGLCHLLGFTHSTEAEWQKMHQKEKQVLEELGQRLGTRLQPLSRASSDGTAVSVDGRWTLPLAPSIRGSPKPRSLGSCRRASPSEC